ncbi:MAG TPA: hypothetical protein VGI82_07860 [Chitinophagaceae bacterium]
MTDIEMIDDAYWLKFAKDHVTNALTARDDAASKLDTFITYVWSVYTAVFTAALAFGEVPAKNWVKFIMVLPVILFPVAKFLCMEVQLPVPVNFYPNIPQSIENDGYATIIRSKNRMLNIAKAAVIVSAFSIALSIFVFRLDGLSAKQNDFKNFYVKVNYSNGGNTIQVRGMCEPNKMLTVFLAGGIDSANNQHHFEITPALQSDQQGRFDTIVDNNGIKNNVKAYVSCRITTVSFTR